MIWTAIKISALVLLALLIIGTILTIQVILLFKNMINSEMQKTEKESDNAKEPQKPKRTD